MEKKLFDKNVVITGGGSWIGKQIAKTFAKEGANVFLIGKNEKNLAETVNEINSNGGKAYYSVADVCKERIMTETINDILEEVQGIDCLIVNAGIYPVAYLESMTLGDWQYVIDVNLTGAFITLKASLSALIAKSAGRIIFISSIAGEKIGLPGLGHYAASKAGLNGLMRTAALELAKYKITVNSIEPGNVFNQEAYQISEIEIAQMQNHIPLGRLGNPADIANMALYLASDEASFITGQTFVVDGGEIIS